MTLMERVYQGTLVAEHKYKANPQKFHAAGLDDDDMKELLRRKEREVEIIEKVRRSAETYSLPKDKIEELFKWIIETTIQLEVDYIRRTKLKTS